MKYHCAMQMKGCYYTTIGYRGICSNCYAKLKDWNIIHKGDRFTDFPEWLKEFIRLEANNDTKDNRHPTENYDDYEEILGQRGKPTKKRQPLGVENCYKLRKLTSLGGYSSTN